MYIRIAVYVILLIIPILNVCSAMTVDLYNRRP